MTKQETRKYETELTEEELVSYYKKYKEWLIKYEDVDPMIYTFQVNGPPVKYKMPFYPAEMERLVGEGWKEKLDIYNEKLRGNHENNYSCE